MRRRKTKLLNLAELAGDKPHPEAVVAKFQAYIRGWERFAKRSKSEKHEREAELLRVMEKSVVHKCKSGLGGCARSIVEFLQNVAGNRRTQSAIKVMSNGNLAKPEVRWQRDNTYNAPAPKYVGYPPQKLGGWNSGGRGRVQRGGNDRGTVPPNLQCFICKDNHFASRCPMRK
jgi:hypothetical protein